MPLAADLPADLVTLYDKIRESSGGSARRCCAPAAAADAGWSCPARDLARIKAAAPDEVVRCEECRRIMVRTAESGL